MNIPEVKLVASQSLNALNDTRVMVPSDATEALADLKNILRGLLSGSLIITPAPTAVAPGPPDGTE